jgi:hypothetical protein
MTPPIPNSNSNLNNKNDDKNDVNLNEISLAAQVDINDNSEGDSDQDDLPIHYDQNGQIVYQQLNIEDNNHDDDDDDDDEFDGFQELAQSRLSTQGNKVFYLNTKVKVCNFIYF